MTIKEAIKQRHMVRKYTDKPIPSNLVELLNARIAENNTAHGLNMKLVIGNSDGIGGMAKMLLTKTVHSYIVLAGKENSDLDEKLGYCGADLCLYAQTLGLNTWWCGVIAIGYGQTQGVQHKSKTAAEISQYNGTSPQWFVDGVDALLYAPTALNKQPYMVKGDGSKVTITAGEGHFSGIDLGIGKYHFEVGAGKENFDRQ